jgi:hypothetical protein
MALLAGAGTLAMMLVTCADVVLRAGGGRSRAVMTSFAC